MLVFRDFHSPPPLVEVKNRTSFGKMTPLPTFTPSAITLPLVLPSPST